jgi:hypothetical protein
MRLYKTLLIATLVLAGSALNANEAPITDAIRNDRTIIIAKRDYVFTPASPLDAGHAKMRSLGIFSEDEINTLDEETLVEFKDKYGLDLSSNNPNVIYNPTTGTRVLPGIVTLLPATLGTVEGQNWVVVTDTKNPKREFEWTHYHFANLAIFSSNYVIPQNAEQYGATVKPGDIYFRGIFVHAKGGADPAIHKNSEKFQTRSIKLSVQSNNMWNIIEYYLSYELYDKHHNKGFVISTTATENDPADGTGIPYIYGHHIITFDNCPEVDENDECE